jgi:glutathione S-transferase
MITLYHCSNSRSMRTLWLLNELQLKFKLVTLPFSMEALRTPEYLSISPLGRVPCIVDENLRLYESGAICQYLCENYGETELYRGVNSDERTLWLQWLHFAETIAVHAAALVQQEVFIAPEKRSDVIKKLESRRLVKALEIVDAQVTKTQYLLPSGFSAVDTAVGYSIHLASKFLDLTEIGEVRLYYQRLKERPAFKLAESDLEWNSSLED